jgi:putative glutathione S-transferase
MASESGKKHTVFSTLANEKGDYVRKASVFRNFVTVDGSSGFPAERDRYHLYVSLACPWAHRTLIYRKLKGLEDLLPVTVVDWLLMNNGWEFTDKKPKCSLDPLYGCKLDTVVHFNRTRPLH